MLKCILKIITLSHIDFPKKKMGPARNAQAPKIN